MQLTLGAITTSIPNSHLSIISETCTLYSTYKIMRDNTAAEFSHLTSLLQSTMTHGCLHVSPSKLAFHEDNNLCFLMNRLGNS